MYDLYRADFEPADYREQLAKQYAASGHVFMMRARGKHELVPIVLPSPYRFDKLVQLATAQLMSTITDFKVDEFYQFTLLPTRRIIANQSELDAVPIGSEIEVIFV